MLPFRTGSLRRHRIDDEFSLVHCPARRALELLKRNSRDVGITGISRPPFATITAALCAEGLSTEAVFQLPAVVTLRLFACYRTHPLSASLKGPFESLVADLELKMKGKGRLGGRKGIMVQRLRKHAFNKRDTNT
jgi:hypothetical protein